MAIKQPEWLVPGYVIYSALEGEVTRDDILRFDDLAMAMFDSGKSLFVHSIVNLEAVTRTAKVNDAIASKSIRHPRLGWTLTIGNATNPVLRMVTEVITSLAKVRYRDVKSLDDALLFLKERDASMPDIQALIGQPLDVMLQLARQQSTSSH